MASLAKSTLTTLEMIKWEHSIFALPFALTGAMLAANGWPTGKALLWIVVCMVSARSAAMAFNRLVDADLDSANPRTAMRAIPAGALTKGFVGAFVIVASLLFFLGAAMLNRLTLLLAPLALAVIFAYSYMKRITRWSHIVLGFALGIAPSAAWIAVRGSFDPRIALLTALVTCWVGGFDVLYACQDFEHDRAAGLHSIPAALGLRGAFWLARVLHLCTVVLMLGLVMLFHLTTPAYVGVAICTLLLAYEHSIVAPGDLSRMNAAFFTLNGVISVVFFVAIATDVLLRP